MVNISAQQCYRRMEKRSISAKDEMKNDRAPQTALLL
jgi:hypothetical protein